MVILVEYAILMAAAAAIVYVGHPTIIKDPADKREVSEKALLAAAVQLIVSLIVDKLSRSAVTLAGNAPPDDDWDTYERDPSQRPGGMNVFEALGLGPLAYLAATSRENKAFCWGIVGVLAFLSLTTPGGTAPNVLVGRE